MKVVSNKSLNEPRIYANRLLGFKLNTQTKVAFRRDRDGNIIKTQENLQGERGRLSQVVSCDDLFMANLDSTDKVEEKRNSDAPQIRMSSPVASDNSSPDVQHKTP